MVSCKLHIFHLNNEFNFVLYYFSDVCLRTFTVTDMEFESNVKNWFKNGS